MITRDVGEYMEEKETKVDDCSYDRWDVDDVKWHVIYVQYSKRDDNR